MSREHELLFGFSSNRERRRAATGLIIFRATERKPEWHRLPGSLRKSTGDTGAELRFTAQSINVWLPLIAKTMQFIWSTGTDFIIMALVPIRQSAFTKASRSDPVGLMYARWEYWAARQRSGYEGRYSWRGGRLGGRRELVYRLAFAK